MRSLSLLLPALILSHVLEAQTSGGQQQSAGATAASQAAAQPFGIRPGMTEAELRRIARLDNFSGTPGIFTTPDLPAGRPGDFAAYTLVISPRRGLCKLIAVSPPMETAASLKWQFQKVKLNLIAYYGGPRDFEGYIQGATLTDAKDWMKAVARREAVLSAAWLKEYGASLPTGIDGIIADVSANAENQAFATATFYFGSERTCDEERRQAR
jgi:hypothetical protein